MTTRFMGALAALFAASLLAAPVAAQSPLVLTQEADLFCEPGPIGIAGEYANPAPGPEGVTRALVAFQCEDFLTDGTYVPQGYRLQVFYDCGGAECFYPFAFALPTHRPALYTAVVYEDGARIRLQIRRNRRDQLIVRVIEIDLDTRERTNRRFVLDPVA
jgi:hypothetical protein